MEWHFDWVWGGGLTLGYKYGEWIVILGPFVLWYGEG